jgi:taurine dioxygenase
VAGARGRTAWDDGLCVVVHEPLGVTVEGLALPHIDDDSVVGLQELLAHHGVVILPGQDVDDAGFVGFLARFGALTFTKGETPVPGHPDLNVVSNIGRTTPPRSAFHTDTSYVARPPTFTALRAVLLPECGGETLFTSQYRAYDTLPPAMVAALDGRTITHVATGVDISDDDESAAEHPVFPRHPISGRTAIYLSTPQRCVAISGMSAEDAREAVAFLYAHSTADGNTYRHAWSPGDIIMWDNRCVLHKADHSGVQGPRVLHRGLVIGRSGQ